MVSARNLMSLALIRFREDRMVFYQQTDGLASLNPQHPEQDNKKGYWASHGPEYPEFACPYNLVVTGNGDERRHDRLPYGQQRT